MKLTKDEKKSLAHALMHVKANKIHEPLTLGGWHCGNRSNFVKRHKKAIDLLLRMIAEATAETNP
jgi:hypothetical protein